MTGSNSLMVNSKPGFNEHNDNANFKSNRGVGALYMIHCTCKY